MADEDPATERRSNSTAKASGRSSSSSLPTRSFARASTFGNITNALDRRRDSLVSDSVDGARRSFKSSTDDLLLPRVKNTGLATHHEPSHWHSAPLGLALLPAFGGLFFKNGSAIITDVTLLLLAAVFLNWSVRLPWDWYCSAQRIRLRNPNASDDFYPGNNEVIEEENEDEEVETDPPSPQSRSKSQEQKAKPSQELDKVESELRIHELTALFSCFIFPATGAWLLHAIRGQLSRPSEGLVSNYNLTIFLLGAELRPLSHLIKMIQSRTLYLQRIVNNNPYEEEKIDNDKVLDLSKRLDELESNVADKLVNASSNGNAPTPTTGQMSTQVRKDLQPDLDALNRAVRRYEKRATLLTMQTEARLQELESRMADAITLAAAAERSTSNKKRGSASILFDMVCATIVFPAQTAWTMLSLPAHVAARALEVLESYFATKVRTELKTAGKLGKSGGSRPSGRGGKKAS